MDSGFFAQCPLLNSLLYKLKGQGLMPRGEYYSYRAAVPATVAVNSGLSTLGIVISSGEIHLLNSLGVVQVRAGEAALLLSA